MRLARVLPALAAIGCGHGSVAIGVAGPLHQPYGLMNLQGIQLAAGDSVRITSCDDNGEEAKAVACAQGFVDDPSVAAVVGHMSSAAQLAAANVYDGRLVSVATTASSPWLTGVSPWVFRVISSDSANGADFARFASSTGVRRAAVIYENTSYGRGLANAFRRQFTGTLTAFAPISGDGATSFEPYAGYVKRSATDLLFAATTQDPAIAMLREVRRQRAPVTFLSVGGSSWANAVSDSAFSEGIYLATPFYTGIDRPQVQAFVRAFQAKFHRMPDGDAALAYDATMLVMRAMRAAGTNRGRIREYLHALTPEHAVDGVTGPIAFAPSGDPAGRSFVFLRAHARRFEAITR
ncbi:MAG TPA: branched-chain amino acid ABC transporter substrate-binding protein [Gemmatimonadaceae bacterium]|nr:branched-chain amino acid ABC transporter substrate-binding protein [Gemmatimonadaceae bacterium]